MHIIHKIHKVIRCPIAAGRTIVSGHLISPGLIQGMLHHRHQLHMGVTHFLYIFRQANCDLPVIIELGAHNIFP